MVLFMKEIQIFYFLAIDDISVVHVLKYRSINYLKSVTTVEEWPFD